MRITRAAKVAAFPLIVLALVALVACQGGPGTKGDKGDKGDMGDAGQPGMDAPRNMPPALKAGKMIGTQNFAMLAQAPDGTAAAGGNKLIGSLKVSDYFEDPEGVANLIFSLVKLSDDDEKIVNVFLTNAPPELEANDSNVFATNMTPTHMESVSGPAYLIIQAEKEGTVTLSLSVKDGLPNGDATHPIPVMVRKSNAGPVAQISVLTAAAYTAMSRVDANRIASTGAVTVDVPDGAFFDADNEVLTVTAAVGPTDDDAAKAANAAILGVSIDGNGDLVLTPKKGSANADIPVILTATDRYGKTAVTATAGIQVHVNTPPMLDTYDTNGGDIPTGKKAGDKKALADIVDKTFSVGAQGTMGVDFIELSEFFVDPDDQDGFTGQNSICDFVTVPADQKNAEVAFDTDRNNIQIKALKRGLIDVVVTCTDGKEESVTDRVTVTIRN